MKTLRSLVSALSVPATLLLSASAFAQAQPPTAAPVIAPAPPPAPPPAAPPPPPPTYATPPMAAQPQGAFEGGGAASTTAPVEGPPTMSPQELPPEHRASGLPRKGSSLFHVNWDMSYPIGSFNNFIGETSFRGIEMEGRFFLMPQLSFGIGGAWQLYSQTRAKSTYELDAGAITTTLYRSNEVFALRFSAHYYPTKMGPLQPFVGVAMGPSSTLFQTLAADFVVSQSSWWFTIQPEAGILLGMERDHRSYGLSATFRYTWMPAKFSNVENLQTIGGQFGVYVLM